MKYPKTAFLSVHDKRNISKLFKFFNKNDFFMISTDNTKKEIIKSIIDKRAGSNELKKEAIARIEETLEKKISSVDHFPRMKKDGSICFELDSGVYHIGGEDPGSGIGYLIMNPGQDEYGPEEIGMITAAVKKHPDKAITVVDPKDYPLLIDELAHGDISPKTKRYLDDKAMDLVKKYKDRFL